LNYKEWGAGTTNAGSANADDEFPGKTTDEKPAEPGEE
jgi:hypothetical protein